MVSNPLGPEPFCTALLGSNRKTPLSILALWQEQRMGRSFGAPALRAAGFAGPAGLWRDKLLDEGFEKLCLICSSLPPITGPTRSGPPG